MRRRIATFVVIAQLILFLAHGFVYWTWLSFFGYPDPLASSSAKIVLAVLSVSFIVASLIGFRYSNFLIRVFYTITAVWMALLNFLLLAAFLSWVSYALIATFHVPIERRIGNMGRYRGFCSLDQLCAPASTLSSMRDGLV